MRRICLIFLLMIPARLLLGQAGGGLPAPTRLEASDGAYSTKVGLSWDAIRGATSYQVFRGTTNNPGSAVMVGATPSLIFHDTTAVPGQTYFYWARAANANATSPFSAPDQGVRGSGRNDFAGTLMAPLQPPPEPPGNPVTAAKVHLGKALFWDEQLSSTRTVACGACHRPRNGGSDPRSVIGSPRSLHPGFDNVFGTADDVVGSPGVPMSRADGSYEFSSNFSLREQVTPRKAQSAIDAGYSRFLFWDGRATQQLEDPITGEVVLQSGAALESQALAPFTEPSEMSHEGAGWENVVARIVASVPLALSPSIPEPLSVWIGGRGYPELFAEAFGTPEVTPTRVAMAIASYERTLYSDRTLFDRVVSRIAEYAPAEQRGFQVFLDAKCDGCHRGGLMSDHIFHYIGLRPAEEDIGRSKFTGQIGEFGRFRTPSLRNAALRGPFMHDGRFNTLEEVVDFYDRGGDFSATHLNRTFIRTLNLSAQQKSDLVVFMKNALTDPRVEAEAGPLFDRPMLYAESARVPQIVGTGSSGSGGAIPQVVAIEPPVTGNPNFTVGLFNALGGARAVLVIHESDPGAGPNIPATASFFRGEVDVEGSGAGNGYTSLSLPIPNNPALIGNTLFGRWFVESGSGVSATPAFRMTIFGPGTLLPAASALSSVSAASLAMGLVAPESIVSGFGAGLAATEDSATNALPTTLAGASVLIQDSTGSERLAPLFYASPRQINYLVPAGTAPGEATVSVLRNSVTAATGKAQVAEMAPALFAANSDGQGAAAALVLRAKPDGSTTFEPAARFDRASGRLVSAPIDLGPETHEVFLVLFGTGIRFRGAAEVTATLGGVSVDVTFAGPQGEFTGVDQVNLRLPRSLAGRGEVDVLVKVGGQPCNTVRVEFR